MLVNRLKFGAVARTFRLHAAVCIVWGTIIVVADTLAHHPERFGTTPGLLSAALSRLHWDSEGVPFNAIAALGSALAIFLGFRNNSAYDRWWEARKIWGALINDSRSWCRQVLAWIAPLDSEPEAADNATRLQTELIHRHLAFVHGLAHHLRNQRPELLKSLQGLVPEEEATRYESLPNVPTGLLISQGARLAQARRRGELGDVCQLAMDSILTRLSDVQGKCERIKNTPIPRQYDAFPRWSVYAYATILPLGFVSTMGWGAVPISTAISLIFLALEASGRAIEDPFDGSVMGTPLTALSITIERDLRAALGEPIPEAVKPDREGVLM